MTLTSSTSQKDQDLQVLVQTEARGLCSIPNGMFVDRLLSDVAFWYIDQMGMVERRGEA